MKRHILFAGAIALAASTGALAAGKAAMPSKATAKTNMLTAKFKAWDANHDGTLTKAELISSSMSAKNQKYVGKVIASADRNHDGKIGPKEFNRSVEARLARVEA